MLCETVKLLSDFENDKFAAALFWCMGMIILLSPGKKWSGSLSVELNKDLKSLESACFSLENFIGFCIRFLNQVMQLRRANRLCVDQLGILDDFLADYDL